MSLLEIWEDGYVYINKKQHWTQEEKQGFNRKKNTLLHTFSRHANKASISFPPCTLNGDTSKSVSFLTSWLKYL